MIKLFDSSELLISRVLHLLSTNISFPSMVLFHYPCNVVLAVVVGASAERDALQIFVDGRTRHRQQPELTHYGSRTSLCAETGEIEDGESSCSASTNNNSQNIMASNKQAPQLSDEPKASKSSIGFGSDAIAEQLSRLHLNYIALVPGSSYRGLHDSIVNYKGNANPQMILCLHEVSFREERHWFKHCPDQ